LADNKCLLSSKCSSLVNKIAFEVKDSI